jgi:formaldehyde-activating enzyme involved in methanogenesis
LNTYDPTQHEDRYTALKNGSKLKDIPEFANIYVKPDTTDNVKVFEYELRKRRNSMSAALSEVDPDARRYAVDKSGKK